METRPLGITQIGLKRTQQIYLFSSTETGNNTIQPADYDEIYLIRKKNILQVFDALVNLADYFFSKQSV